MLRKTTITLLRIPFSYFLMPVFFFSLSQLPSVDFLRSLFVFCLLHFLVYPASNGYNSYMDRDTGSIGMLEKPPLPTRELFYLTAGMDLLAALLSFWISLPFALCIIANVLASRAYSYRGIRLKQYPLAGFLTVVIFQGAITYLMVQLGCTAAPIAVPWLGMLASSLLFGGFYPLTQIYQHQQDLRDGVRTISYVLGIHGSFIFSGIMYALAEVVLYVQFASAGTTSHFWLMQLFLVPVLGYFVYWWAAVRRDNRNASFAYAMRMNLIAATCTNAGFVLLFLTNHIF